MNMEPTRKQSLGLFHMLPYEIRQLIWSDLVPPRKDGRRKKQAKTTDLGILRTSKGIYNEVSRLLYKDTNLIISLNPLDIGSDRFKATIYFEQIIRPLRRNGAKSKRTLWSQPDANYMESSGFCSLPFHKFSDVIVTLYSPHRSRPHELFLLWRYVTQLISILKRTTIDSLTIRLQKNPFNSNWVDACRRPLKSSVYQVINSRHDYDVVCMPFFALRNLKDIRVEALSEIRRVMDWKLINKGTETVLNKAWGYCESPMHKDYGGFGHDVDRAIAGDYFWLHLKGWKTDMFCSERRRDFLSQWFDRDGNSEFETQIKRIVDRYPEIIDTYDPEMKILEEMHMRLVTLYSYAKSEHGDGDLSNWDQELWNTAFKSGIPKLDQDCVLKGSPGSKRLDLVYLKHTKKHAYLSTMIDIIIDWKQRKTDKPFWRYPSCEEYGVRRSYLS